MQYLFATRDALRIHTCDIHASNHSCFIAISPLSNLSSDHKASTANFLRPAQIMPERHVVCSFCSYENRSRTIYTYLI